MYGENPAADVISAAGFFVVGMGAALARTVVCCTILDAVYIMAICDSAESEGISIGSQVG